ncbi:MAG TPA: CopG family transcriptional regulator [Candidatus Xenobia bacterium]
MKIVTVKLNDDMAVRLTTAAHERGTTRSEVIRLALAAYLEDSKASSKPPSFLDLAWDLCGSVDGPEDLSTNKKYMEGFGR